MLHDHEHEYNSTQCHGTLGVWRENCLGAPRPLTSRRHEVTTVGNVGTVTVPTSAWGHMVQVLRATRTLHN
jgi:hypothetical protein